MLRHSPGHDFKIKIYPEWNVNPLTVTAETYGVSIKIYPEWNVNRDWHFLSYSHLLLKSTQSGM